MGLTSTVVADHTDLDLLRCSLVSDHTITVTTSFALDSASNSTGSEVVNCTASSSRAHHYIDYNSTSIGLVDRSAIDMTIATNTRNYSVTGKTIGSFTVNSRRFGTTVGVCCSTVAHSEVLVDN